MYFTTVLDIDDIGRRCGGNAVEESDPYGGKILRVEWTPALAQAAVTYIQSALAEIPAPTVCHSGNAPMWVMAAAVGAMGDASITFTPPVPGVYQPICRVPQGELVPEAEVAFQIRRDGDILFIHYLADNPQKPMLYGGGHHSYNPDLIPRIQAPEVEKNIHVCLSGNSSYNVTMSIARAYLGHCRSLSIQGGADPDFYCCYTTCPERCLGDITPECQSSGQK